MDAQAKEWKLAIERLYAEPTLDTRAAALLAAEMARPGMPPELRQAAAQALPSLRNAMAKKAERGAKDLARRRLGAVLNELRVLTAPRFGKRRRSSETMSPDEAHRHLLGLPSSGRLSNPEIHQAYKRAAKTMHPDGGGTEQAFHDLAAARDALIKDG